MKTFRKSAIALLAIVALLLSAQSTAHAVGCLNGIGAQNNQPFAVCVVLTVDCGAGPVALPAVNIPPGLTFNLTAPGCCVVSVEALTPVGAIPPCVPQAPPAISFYPPPNAVPLGAAYPLGATISARRCHFKIL